MIKNLRFLWVLFCERLFLLWILFFLPFFYVSSTDALLYFTMHSVPTCDKRVEGVAIRSSFIFFFFFQNVYGILTKCSPIVLVVFIFASPFVMSFARECSSEREKILLVFLLRQLCKYRKTIQFNQSDYSEGCMNAFFAKNKRTNVYCVKKMF